MTDHATEVDLRQLREVRDRISRNPDDVAALARMGAMMFEPFHEPEQSIQLLREALKKDTTNVDARFWLAKCLFHFYVDYEGARQLLAEALELDGTRADCLTLMASVLADLGAKPEDYISYLERAVEQAPDWVATHQHLALVQLEIGLADQAEAEANKALALTGTAPATEGSLDEYYESAVTGRAWVDADKDLHQLLLRIKGEKMRKALYGEFRGPIGC